MMKQYAWWLMMIALMTLISCKKKPSAGLGGQASLRIRTVHHGATLDSAMVYIKFNSSEAVGSGEYDVSAAVQSDSSGDAYAQFDGLKKGDYYLYAEGWDPSIFNNVKGGIPYTISEETLQSILLPVTEVH